MRTIYKYPLTLAGTQEVEMPLGAKILSVQEQRGNVYIWALVDPRAPKQQVTFYVVGTGFAFPSAILAQASFIDTVQLPELELVLHVWLQNGSVTCIK